MIARSTALLLAMTAVAAPAAAGGPLQLSSSVLVEQNVRAPDGSVRASLLPARKVVPGDRVVFVLGYRNTGRQPIANVVVANPVPAGMNYRGPTAASAAPEVSVDGRTFGPLAGLRVATVDGGTRAARPDEVRHVRWRLSGAVAPGAQGRLSYQAILK